jgi:hypothetical protein
VLSHRLPIASYHVSIARNASAVLEFFVCLAKKTFSTLSARTGPTAQLC